MRRAKRQIASKGNSVVIPRRPGSLREDMKMKGTYHLQGKTRNFSWKIKWFVPFRLGSFRKSDNIYALI